MNRGFRIGFMMILGMLWAASGCELSDRNGQPILVTKPIEPTAKFGMLEGKPLGMDDLDNATKRSLYRLERQIYEKKRLALDALVSQLLLQREAKNRGLTVAELLQQEVYGPSAIAGEREIISFLAASRDEIDALVQAEVAGLDEGGVQAVERVLASTLKKRHLQQQIAAYVERLRADVEVQVFLEPPAPLRQQIHPGESILRGEKNARVRIVEFGSCGDELTVRMEGVMAEIFAQNHEEIVWYFRHRPKSKAFEVTEAHQLLACAQLHGKFGEMHEVLMKNWDHLSSVNLEVYERMVFPQAAERRDLAHCLEQKRFEKVLLTDQMAGEDLGLGERMVFFVNGVEVPGLEGPEVLRRIVTEELSRSAFLALQGRN